MEGQEEGSMNNMHYDPFDRFRRLFMTARASKVYDLMALLIKLEVTDWVNTGSMLTYNRIVIEKEKMEVVRRGDG